MPFEVIVLDPSTASFPSTLRTREGAALFPHIWTIGNLAILEQRLLGFFCSTRCPGEIIIRTYDVARALRDAGVTVIGGFHSPMEKECLRLLLRGTQPVIVCPARSIERIRIPGEWKTPLAEGRMLLLSPFGKKLRRVSAPLAEKRNKFVAALAEEVFAAHAAPGSKTEQFCHDILTLGKPLLTVESDENIHLLALGAQPFSKPL